MKAILVIDMPDSCIECQLRTFELTGYYGTCLASDDEHDIHAESEWEQNKRWSGCPLKPMPMKRISTVDWLHTETQTQSATSIGKYPSDYTQIKTYEPSDYDKGWNDCVDFMEGGEQ
jgi:hypothetical protein